MLEVNPGSETKLSGFTAVSDFRGGQTERDKRKGENGKGKTHRSSLAAHLYRPLRPSGTSPNLGEESRGEPTFMFQSFKFHVSIHFVPLSQGYEEQSSGGGMFLRSSFPALFYYIPPPLRSAQRRTGEFSSRRTGECSPQRVQNDIQSFL